METTNEPKGRSPMVLNSDDWPRFSRSFHDSSTVSESLEGHSKCPVEPKSSCREDGAFLNRSSSSDCSNTDCHRTGLSTGVCNTRTMTNKMCLHVLPRRRKS